MPTTTRRSPAPRSLVAPHPPVASAAPTERATVREDARALLAWTGALLDEGAVLQAMACLVPGLRAVRDALGPSGWETFVRDECLPHPAADRLREDPFIQRTYAKPRGYAGDAVMLDLIYGETRVPPETTALGRALYAVNVEADACRSVRERRAILTAAIDAAAARAPGGARILSLACGHLREAQSSTAVRDGAIAAFHAVDQDPLSIALLHREHAPLGVTPEVGSVRDVLRGTVRHEGLTLAYAAGLYDYLPAPVAARLTRRLFEMLAPGGRLLVANFCPELVDVGVMEGVMDWRLIYRDEREVEAFAAELPEGEVAERRVWRDSLGCGAYLEVVRD
jgi:hypothetical protein